MIDYILRCPLLIWMKMAGAEVCSFVGANPIWDFCERLGLESNLQQPSVVSKCAQALCHEELTADRFNVFRIMMMWTVITMMVMMIKMMMPPR